MTMPIKRLRARRTGYLRMSRLLFLLIPCLPLKGLSANGDDDVEKKKTINKSYHVTPETKLKIDNSFGDVVVATWDKDEITVDVEIMVRSSSEERAKELLDDINVQEDNSGGAITYKTHVGNTNEEGGHKNKNKNGNKTFHINYSIHMPDRNRLSLENSFGKITMPDFKGDLNLTSKFGGLTAGLLQNVETIDVEFGSAVIGGVNNGKLTFKFDNESTIGKLSGSVKINCEFSQRVVFNVDNSISELTVNESYSTLKLIVPKTLSAGFTVHTSFGNFKNESDFSIKESRDEDDNTGPRFDKDFAGKAGDGKAGIKIKSSFGNIQLTHDATEHTSHREGKNKKDKDDDEKEEKEKDKDPA